MLSEIDFRTKYNTTQSQMHEESFLEEVSEEDKDMYSEVEILCGRSLNGDFNKFNNAGKVNRGIRHDTVKTRFVNQFKKYVDNKLEEGKEEEVFDRLWKSGKNGSFQHLQFLFERIAGKTPDKIDIKIDKIDVELNIPDKFKKKED